MISKQGKYYSKVSLLLLILGKFNPSYINMCGIMIVCTESELIYLTVVYNTANFGQQICCKPTLNLLYPMLNLKLGEKIMIYCCEKIELPFSLFVIDLGWKDMKTILFMPN